MIIVIGGGITGLAVAYELARCQQPFLLLEASSRVGGLIATEQVGGFTVEAGPDSVLIQKPAAIQLCEQLGLGSRLMSTRQPRTAFVVKQGRLHPLPPRSVLGIPTTFSAALQYDLLSWGARARLMLEPLAPRGAPTDESVASFFRRRFGPETVGLIAEPLLGGIHAGDVERLSVRSLFPRLVEAEHKPGKVIKNLRARSADNHEGVFRALRGGMSELVTAIASRLPAESIRVQSPAHAVLPSQSCWQVGVPGDRYEADAVVIAAPAHAASACLRAVDSEAAKICQDVPYASTVSVALGYRRQDIHHPLQGSGFVVARRFNRLRISACTWVSSKWESRAPSDHALIRAFMGGVHDPHVITLPDDELIDIAGRDLADILGVEAAPVLRRVYRNANAGAQHTVDHRARMTALDARLARHPGLFVVGSGFDSIGIPDCVANGRRVAGAAADYVSMRKIRAASAEE